MFNTRFIYFQGPEAGAMSSAEAEASNKMSEVKSGIESSLDEGVDVTTAVDAAKKMVEEIKNTYSAKFSSTAENIPAAEKAYRVEFENRIRQLANNAISQIDQNLTNYNNQAEAIKSATKATAEFENLKLKQNELDPQITKYENFSQTPSFNSQADVDSYNATLDEMEKPSTEVDSLQKGFASCYATLNTISVTRVKDNYKIYLEHSQAREKNYAEKLASINNNHDTLVDSANSAITSAIDQAKTEMQRLRDRSGNYQQRLASNPAIKAEAMDAYNMFTNQKKFVESLGQAQKGFSQRKKIGGGGSTAGQPIA